MVSSTAVVKKGCSMSYKFFQNKECEFFPCHSEVKDFNCLFCYCPLNHIKECGGTYTILQNGWKDCSGCVIPHTNYDYIIKKLKEVNYENKRNSNCGNDDRIMYSV